ncbi:MAG: EAL domain-containing protein, partial [Leptospiraceae bacterium]|nr:EAL domain-containing protein [Leptospiraceae bacterium]
MTGIGLNTSSGLELSDVHPFFQPIIDLSDMEIRGYGVLGRRRDKETDRHFSLGPVFHALDPTAPADMEFIFKLDHHIQAEAFERLRSGDSNTRLFLNIMPAILNHFYPDPRKIATQFHLREMIDRLGIDPARIVLEITEEEFPGDYETFIQIVQALKHQGFKIAVDDLGAGTNDLSRLAFLMPDIIKIDLNLLHVSRHHASHRQLLMALSFIAHRLGAELLFEGIEEEEELMIALKMGGRFVQGFYFSPAEADFQAPDCYRDKLHGLLDEYSRYRIAELISRYQMRKEMLSGLGQAFRRIQPGQPESDIADELNQQFSSIPDQIHSVAFFDLNGNRISDRYTRNGVQWIRNPGEQNISWRSHFQETLADFHFYGNSFRVS